MVVCLGRVEASAAVQIESPRQLGNAQLQAQKNPDRVTAIGMGEIPGSNPGGASTVIRLCKRLSGDSTSSPRASVFVTGRQPGRSPNGSLVLGEPGRIASMPLSAAG